MELVVITGANRGIGLALTDIYCRRGCTVLGACRQSSDALAATGAEVLEQVDISRAAAPACAMRSVNGISTC